jgi:hypothetical protein
MLTAEIMQRAGFIAPPVIWTKDDPRGGDYGHYEATVESNGNYKVNYICADHPDYDFTMYFKTTTDFVRWAKC